jgi:hypothetical protein
VRVLGTLALLASLAALAVGDRGGTRGDFSLAAARAFGEFPLYYAGKEVDGVPLTAVLRRSGRAHYVSFLYGDCTPASDAGCAPPAEVQVWRSVDRNAGSYDRSVPGSPTLEQTRIRGRPAAFVGDGALEIYADESTVVVFAGSRERLLAIAKALRCVQTDSDGTGNGRLECRR